jgi:ATP adenylyltransferase
VAELHHASGDPQQRPTQVTDLADSQQGLAHLFAGWRAAGFTASKTGRDAPVEDSCVFCRIVATGLTDHKALIFQRSNGVMAVMNLYPYSSGHLLVMPTRHVPDLGSLSEDEATELWRVIRHAEAVIRRTYHPDGVNIGINQGLAAGASIPDHLHVHIVPRWTSDTNFMTAVADTRVLIETVAYSYERLSTNW